MTEPAAPAPAPATAPMPVTARMFERLELRVVQLEEELKDAKLEIARLKAKPAEPAPAAPPAVPARKRSGILRERE